MDNLKVWSNSRVNIQGQQGDPTSISQSLYAFSDGGSFEVLDKPFTEIDGVKVTDLSFTAPEDIVETVYEYYVTENFVSADPIIYPSPDNCSTSGCELPTITICPLGNEGS